MKEPYLIRYRFASKIGSGVSVTACDLQNAVSLIKEKSTAMAFNSDFHDYLEDVDIQELDQNHVIPNTGVMIYRGVWYPFS